MRRVFRSPPLRWWPQIRRYGPVDLLKIKQENRLTFDEVIQEVPWCVCGTFREDFDEPNTWRDKLIWIAWSFHKIEGAIAVPPEYMPYHVPTSLFLNGLAHDRDIEPLGHWVTRRWRQWPDIFEEKHGYRWGDSDDRGFWSV